MPKEEGAIGLSLGFQPQVPIKSRTALKGRQNCLLQERTLIQQTARNTFSSALSGRVLVWLFPGVETPGLVLFPLRGRNRMLAAGYRS